ncbi:KpsF/GutQ family sugar-phosphate isomerase [Sphingomonas sp. BIUV-7]|uniref:KpsF/GutQ family sugar-phosphate isomerase n=1 Tax=Sphingomonas natans TaxID=3063330 RepID=A0ABT8Y5U5_9SPHN|nr:KpsF/GutQ family sugar-phosphate isomerase [Sphingomonas sp. BIUV-7]MDO6413690.1 KpsF/GutQ family sugar-phosphate isomerase [Sphingomonas sp. BIUV-7]
MPAQDSAPARINLPPADLVAYGRQVIATEANGLLALSASLDDRFAEAVSILLSLRGRVVTTGMGKSGYVARKVMATLSSTGLPSVFIHPAEAAHGDLGMLAPGDGLIAFSNSGETSELQPVVAHARKLGVPIIAVAGRAESLLMRQADVGILLPSVGEACPANLAPTTSTAMMMAVGDALALAAMQVRGVSRAGFEELHPGGAIGKRMMRVAAIMHRDAAMPIVTEDCEMRDVIMMMTSRSFGMTGVVDRDGRLVGVITDGDLRRHFDSLIEGKATDMMTPDPKWVSPGCLIEDALTLLNKHKITAMFAVEDDGTDRPVGIVHVHDFLRLGLA